MTSQAALLRANLHKAGCRVLGYEDREEWQALLRTTGADDVFFHPDYLKINEIIVGGTTECFVWQRGKSIVVYPYLKRPIESSGLFDITSAYGFGGFVQQTDETDTGPFQEAFCRYCRESGIVSEFIRFHPVHDNYRFAQGRRLQVKYQQPVVYADFGEEGFTFGQHFNPQVRQKVRRASRHGLEVVEDTDGRFYDQFIHLYKHTMDIKHASRFYYFDHSFFKSLQSQLGDRAALFVATYQEEVVGGFLVLFSGSCGYLFLTCSDYEHNSLGTSESLYVRALEWAHGRGLKGFLLGGGKQNGDSLFRFKAKFSRASKHYYTGSRIHLPEAYGRLCRQAIDSRGGRDGLHAGVPFPLYRYCIPQNAQTRPLLETAPSPAKPEKLRIVELCART